MITEQLQKKIDRSIKLLQSVAKGYDGEIEVAYSGGKDSDVILQLAKESGINFKAIYKNTTIDPPGTLAHVKAVGAEILRPKKNFFQLVSENGYPNRNMRFCCKYLKEYKVLEKCILGVRKAESRKRDENYDVEEPTKCLGTKKDPREGIYPILEWTDEDVLAFIKDRNIQLAPVYYDFFLGGQIDIDRRLGCMCCPLQYYKGRIAQFKKYPRMVKSYLRAGQKFRDTHPDVKTVHEYEDVYMWFTRDVFFESQDKWEQHRNKGLFPDMEFDYKAFLEGYFGIDLTL